MNHQRLRSSVQRHEGYSETPYRCSQGYFTVGWGHLIHPLQLRALVPHRTVGSLLDMICDRANHERWLDEDLARAESDARRYIGPAFDDLSDVRRETLVEMGFQLGGTGLAGFRRMREAILAERWVMAEAEALDSRWAAQTPERAKTLAGRLLAG